MKKQQYLDALKTALGKLKVEDADDIVLEYSQHFDFKTADGYSEEEVSARLGDPAAAAAQFAQTDGAVKPKTANRLPSYAGIFGADFCVWIFLIIFGAWTIALAGFAAAALIGGGALICGAGFAAAVIPMPYINGLLFGVLFLFLSGLSAAGAAYCFAYMKQLFKAYARWRRNVLNAANGRPVLPPLGIHPQLKPKTKRVLRNIMLISFIGFGIFFIIAYAAAAISAGSFEFWHVWNWFQ